MFIVYLFLSVAIASEPKPIACKHGAVIDLNVHPLVWIDGESDSAFLIPGPGPGGAVGMATLGSTGFVSSGWSFSADTYLEANGTPKEALKKGAYLRLQHGTDLESEFELSTDCYLTYDAAPVVASLALVVHAGGNKAGDMVKLMVCDPEGSLGHAITATTPAGDVGVPVGQAAQGDDVMTISVSGVADSASLGTQRVTIRKDKFAGAQADPAGMFCAAQSFAELCVKPEVVFALTKGAPFEISTEVDSYAMLLSRCTVSR